VNRRFLRLRVFCRLAFDLSLQGHRSPLDEIVRRVGNLLPRVRDSCRSGTVRLDAVERPARIGRPGPVIMKLGPALPGAASLLPGYARYRYLGDDSNDLDLWCQLGTGARRSMNSNDDNTPARLVLRVEGTDADETAERALALRRELMELDAVGRIEPAADAGADPLAEGATKSVGGALSLAAWSLDLVPEVLPKLIDWLKAWQLRDRRVNIKLAVGGNTVEASYDPVTMTAAEIESVVMRLKRQLPSAD
jgi:hypothetical protein